MEVPMSTPKVALRAETGLRSMKHRIWFEKVSLVLAIRRMQGGLAKEVYEEQVAHGWPGLAKEVEVICSTIGVPDANNNIVNKRDLDKALRTHDGSEIREKFGKYKKIDRIVEDDPTEPKIYMKQKSLSDSRLIFRLRTEMVDVRDNMRNKYKGSSVHCDACNMEEPESQVHVMACPGYEDLRAGKDMSKDGDLVSYFREVLLLREKRKLTK